MSTPGNLDFLLLDGDPAGPKTNGPGIIRVTGSSSWRAVVNPSWATLDASAGSQARDIQVSVARGSLGVGSHQAVVTIFDDVTNRNFQFPINLNIRPVELVASGAISLTLNSQTTPAGLGAPLVIGDELIGAVPAVAISWTASIDQPWIELSAMSGSSAPSQTLMAQLPMRHANLIPSGTHTATITFAYVDSSGAARTRQVPVSLQVDLPAARAVWPYLVPPNATTVVRLRGEHIRAQDMALMSLQGVPNAAFARVDDNRVDLYLPALPTGEYEVRVANAAGITRSAATVIVGLPAAIGAGVIESPDAKRLIFDEQRGRILGINRRTSQIESYTWNGSAWVAGTTMVVPELADATLARSGKDLIVVARHSISVADANDLSAAPRRVWTRMNQGPNPASHNAIGINDQGAALITHTYAFAGLSGHSHLVFFDALRLHVGEPPTGFDSHYESQLSHSPGGRYTVTSGYGVSPTAPTLVFDSFGTGTTLLGSLTLRDTYSHLLPRGVDYAGTRMIEGTYGVRDMQGTLLGTLEPSVSFDPYVYGVLSPGGTRVFKFVEDPAGPGRIDVQDLTALPAPQYPVIGSIPMPARIYDAATSGDHTSTGTGLLNGLVTRDGKFLILAGTERMVVVNVSGF